MDDLKKFIIRVDPPRSHPIAESEAHYLGVHVPLARIGATNDPDRVAYHTRRVERQYDRSGGWEHRLTAWRFVANWVRSSDGHGEVTPQGLSRAVANDVVHCVRDLRRCEVTEHVLLDRRAGLTSSAMVLFEYDRELTTSADEARALLTCLATSAVDAAEEQCGIRLITANYVVNEDETAPVTESGQLFTGRLLPESDKVGYLEFVFDNQYWAEEFFGNSEIANLMLDLTFKHAAGYLVAERVEFDRR